jgi:3-deoxy-7-phosphoheptulonate synthase
MSRARDANVIDCRPLPTPADFLETMPRTAAQAELVLRTRQAIHDILCGRDHRLIVVVGPCSIHDVGSGSEYGRRLAGLAGELEDRMVVLMRAYFEKPRTGSGWQGLIVDPDMDGGGRIAKGLRMARLFLREMLDLGLPTATEFVNPIVPPYLSDLVCWAAVGARTSESQVHRQLASGLDMPLGFKNGTDGGVLGAIRAVKAAGQNQAFLGISPGGRASALRTRGNPDCHVVLRGGSSGPNYSAMHLSAVESALDDAGLARAVMVDCSHDNSGRHPERQPMVLGEVVGRIAAGNRSIVGVMMESNLLGGSQPANGQPGRLRYGVSVTDGCLDWANTERCLRDAHESIAARFHLEEVR